MAYIKKLPSGNYQAQIRLKDLKPIVKTFKTKRDATIFSREVEGNSKLAQALGDPITTQISLSSLIDDFTKQYNKKDCNIITRLEWWKTEYGAISLAKFNKNHVVEGIKKLMTSGTRGNPLKPQTTNRFKANLSSCFTYAINSGYGIEQNPCKQVPNKSEGKGRQRTFTEDERKRFLDATKQSNWDRFYLYCLMGFTCGARRSELQRLTWKNISFSKKQAFCHDTKNGDNKILHLVPAVIEELKKFREVGNGYIFIGQKGAVHDYRVDWQKAIKLAKISEYDDRYGEKLVFHSERHTFCTNLHKAGQDLKTIQSLAGHKSINTTLRYTHDDEEVKAKAVDDVFGSLGGVK